jgi:hypothetical protein
MTSAPQQRSGQWRKGAAALVLGLLFLLLAFSTAFQSAGAPMDEGTLLVYPEMIQRGAIPYRDFETFYGPANPYLLAAVYTLFGTNIEIERTVGLLYRVVILIAIFGITRRWGTAIATTCMVVSGLLMLPLGIVAFAWFGALACALCFVWAMAQPERRSRCLAGGLLAGLALTFRADVGPAVILAALVLIKPLSQSQRLRFALGATIGLIPFAVVAVIAGPEQTFNNIFLYPVVLSGPGRRIPLFSASPEWARMFLALVLAAVANIIAGILAVRTRPTGRREKLLLTLAVLGAGVMPQAWQRLDASHVLFLAFLVIGILPISVFFIASRLSRISKSSASLPFTMLPSNTAAATVDMMPLKGENRKALWLTFASTAIVLAILFVSTPSLWQDIASGFREALQSSRVSSVFLERGSRSFPVGGPNRVVTIGRMVDDIGRASKPGERLFVGPGDLRRTNYCDTFIYHFLPKLHPATYFLEMNPLSANRAGSRLASDVMSADWLVLNHEWDFSTEQNRSVEYGSPEAANVVKDHFQFISQYGSFGVFRRKP